MEYKMHYVNLRRFQLCCVHCVRTVHCSNVTSVYGVHKVQMLLSGRCVSADALVRIYGVTNVAPTQKDKFFLLSKRRPQLQICKRYWKEHKLAHGSRWGWKPKTSVLARTSCSLLDWTVDSICLLTAMQPGAATAYFALVSVGISNLFILRRSISCVT
jgi:hypothetical protein